MPSFLTPDFGLFFWMLIAFIIVFFVLARFGFPVILNMVNERKKYIDESLRSAVEANERLANINAESEQIIKDARNQQAKILKEANMMKEQIIGEAKNKAEQEGSRIIKEAHDKIDADMQKAKRESRDEIVNISIKIAEKVLSQKLEGCEQQEQWINKVLDEATENN